MPTVGGVYFDNPPGWYESGCYSPAALWPFITQQALEVIFPYLPAPTPAPQAYVGKNTLGDAIVEASLLLNDVSNQKFTVVALVGFAKKAFLDLELKLLVNGLPIGIQIDTIQTIPAGQTFYTLPPDMFRPFKMEERPTGSDSSVLFSPMEEKSTEPNVTVTESLRWWVWRQEGIKFVGANTSRDVRLYYYNLLKDLSSVVDPNQQQLAVTLSKGYLAARTGALAALLIGENTTRASALQDDASSQLDDLISLTVRGRQALPARRRPYRAYKIRTGI